MGVTVKAGVLRIGTPLVVPEKDVSPLFIFLIWFFRT